MKSLQELCIAKVNWYEKPKIKNKKIIWNLNSRIPNYLFNICESYKPFEWNKYKKNKQELRDLFEKYIHNSFFHIFVSIKGKKRRIYLNRNNKKIYIYARKSYKTFKHISNIINSIYGLISLDIDYSDYCLYINDSTDYDYMRVMVKHMYKSIYHIFYHRYLFDDFGAYSCLQEIIYWNVETNELVYDQVNEIYNRRNYRADNILSLFFKCPKIVSVKKFITI